MKETFNIFLSTPINDLPVELKNFIPKPLKFKSLILIGSGGPEMWQHFSAAREIKPTLLDEFSKQKIINWGKCELNEDLSQQFIYPNDQTHFPLQQLARHLNFSHQSPLGIDISFEYGLWFAFRALVATKKEMDLKSSRPFISPCLNCLERPCLSAAESISQARLLCPYQNHMRYCEDQIEFHERFFSQTTSQPQS